MKEGGFLALGALALLAACSGGEGNVAANAANTSAAEGEDLNMAISGDELSPIPEAEDDMIANGSGVGNAVGNEAPPQPPGAATPPSTPNPPAGEP
jgi:hypothetical protein